MDGGVVGGGVVKVLQWWLCTRVEAQLSMLVATNKQCCLLMGVVWSGQAYLAVNIIIISTHLCQSPERMS